MFRDLIDRARLALGDLWRREPARVTGAVVALFTAAGVTVLTTDVAAVLAALVPIVVGTETVRRSVYSPAFITKAADALDHDTPAGGVAGSDRVD